MKITKKLLSYATLFIVAVLFFGLKSKVTVRADSSYDTKGLGYAINIVKASSPTSYNLGAPVINEDYLQNLSYVRTNKLTGKVTEKYDTSISTVTANLGLNYKNSLSGSAEYDPFLIGISNSLKSGLNISFQNYESRYFGARFYDYTRYEMALPSYSDFANTYQSHYSTAFLNNLASLKNSGTKEAYDNFFDTFGTHVVADVLVGGKLRMNYIVVSNSLIFNEETKTKINSAIKSAVNNLGKVNGSTRLTFGTSSSNIISSCTYSTDIEVKGGNLTYANSLEGEDGTNYTNWITSIDDSNAVTIGYGDNGLIPIWDILPTSYSSIKTTMKNYFNTYYNENMNSVKSTFIYSGQKYTKGALTKTELIYNGVLRITDDGRMKNPYVTINLKNLLGVYPTTMINEGMSYITLVLSLSYKDINDGYRHLFLFPTASTANANAYIADYDFDDAGGLVKDWQPLFVEWIFPISDLSSEKLFLRFGASGSGDDDWEATKIEVCFKIN